MDNDIYAPTSTLRQLEKKLTEAINYLEWSDLAKQHDFQSGAEGWKQQNKSRLYDYREVKSRYDNLRELIDNGQHRELLYALNEGVHGNMGGMGRPVMYTQAKFGTKKLIEEYVATIAEALKVIADCPESEITYPEKVDFFRRASHCYGRSALLLSGGAGLIYFHQGVIQELINNDLVPNVMSGSSAGSIISAQVGTMTDAELKADHFINKRYEQSFKTPFIKLFVGGLSDKEIHDSKEQVLDEVIPRDLTFQEAFEKTGRYINISISPAEKHQNSRLMNAITSPNVYIRSAVSASSSIPGVIPAERLYAKGFDGKPRPYLQNRRWVDGSVSGDLPIRRLTRLYGVNHFIVSQINPLVVPFIKDTKSRNRKGFRGTLKTSAISLFNEGLVIVEKLLDRGGSTGNKLAAQIAYLIRMLEQSYLGDVNIILERKDFRWRHVFFEFKDGEIEELIQAGMQSTWPKLSMIKNAALISKTLDQILEGLNQEGMDEKNTTKHHIYT
ncbi:MAG: patatin-like phospholipase family protein [Pseudomonadales bacterium]|nr:patatin-like phospholipase family protein [Pseudomonadales bacterium]